MVGEARARERPLFLVAPFVRSHDEDPDAGDVGVRASDDPIEPPTDISLEVDDGARTELDLAELRARVHAVAPWAHEQALLRSTLFAACVRRHPDEVQRCADLLVVVP